jgi:hypothetical protein
MLACMRVCGVCASVCLSVPACVRVCVCARMRACMRMRTCVPKRVHACCMCMCMCVCSIRQADIGERAGEDGQEGESRVE